MSVLVRYQEVGMTRQKYDEVGALLEEGDFPPPGLELHVLFGEEGSLRVSELWASAEEQRVFNDETLTPILDRAGLQVSGPPEILPVHELVQF